MEHAFSIPSSFLAASKERKVHQQVDTNRGCPNSLFVLECFNLRDSFIRGERFCGRAIVVIYPFNVVEASCVGPKDFLFPGFSGKTLKAAILRRAEPSLHNPDC